MSKPQPPGFQFPCNYKIKAMGLDEPYFETLVVEIIRRHQPDIKEGAITRKPSKTGKYISISVVIEAMSKQQLDAIYDDLTAHEKVLMRL